VQRRDGRVQPVLPLGRGAPNIRADVGIPRGRTAKRRVKDIGVACMREWRTLARCRVISSLLGEGRGRGLLRCGSCLRECWGLALGKELRKKVHWLMWFADICKPMTASIGDEGEGLKVDGTLLNGTLVFSIDLAPDATLKDLEDSLANKLDLEVQMCARDGSNTLISETHRHKVRAYKQLVLELDDGFWACRKYLAAMSVEAFHPSSASFSPNWTLSMAPKVHHSEVTSLLARLEVPDIMTVKFMRLFGRLTSLTEGWNMFDLQILQHLQGGLSHFKHALCEHWLQLARVSITQRVPRMPTSVMLPHFNGHGLVCSVRLFSADGCYPTTFHNPLTDGLDICDVREAVNASLMQVLVSLDTCLQPGEVFAEVMTEAARLDCLDAAHSQWDPTEVVRMVHVQLRLSCGFGVVEVEEILHRPLLECVATLLRWHLKVLHFAGNHLISEACASSEAKIGDLQEHVERGLQEIQRNPRFRGVLVLVLLPMNHVLGDLCSKLSRHASVRFILCVQERAPEDLGATGAPETRLEERIRVSEKTANSGVHRSADR
ncbi:unnamed protein product, partial [Symbiodinium microadriaticum]